jgi:MFS family permease
MLPIMAGSLTTRAPQWATVVIAICILAPQFVVAVIAPWVGRTAQSWGRRPLLMLGFVPLCVRSAVFAASNDPSLIVAAQLLDGISAATLGVLVPLVIADTTRGTGHFTSRGRRRCRHCASQYHDCRLCRGYVWRRAA